MIKDAWSDREITISKINTAVVSKSPCPMSGQPAPEPGATVGVKFRECPDCFAVVSVRANGNFYRHIVRGFSDPRDVIVVRTPSNVIEIAAADVPELIAQLRSAVFSAQEVS